MYPLDVFQSTLQRVVNILDELRIRFHVTGGAAAIAYGDPRSTQDIDLVIDREALQAVFSEFITAFAKDKFLFNTETIRTAVAAQRMFQMLDVEHSLKVDLYPREMIHGELNRSARIEIMPGLTVPVAARTDSAISKLIWISKGSHKSRRDLKQILLFRATDQEMQTVRMAAEERGLTALLDEVLAEPDEIDA